MDKLVASLRHSTFAVSTGLASYAHSSQAKAMPACLSLLLLLFSLGN